MKQFSDLKISSFCGELAWLIHSGIGLGDGLELMAEEEEDRHLRDSLRAIAEEVEMGKALSEAMKVAEGFPLYVQGSIRVGERTGRVEEALRALEVYYEEKERMNHRLKRAVLYPLFLLLLLLLVLGVLLTQVVPTFQSVYASLGGGMTGGAGMMLTLGMWLRSKLPMLYIFFGGILALAIVCVVCDSVRICLGRFFKKYIGEPGVFRKINDASIAGVMAMGLGSGMVLEETMELAAQVMEDLPKAKKRCLLCAEELRKGSSVAEALKKSRILPLGACRLLCIGMQGGNADTVMEELAGKLGEEAGNALESHVAKIEPLLVLITSILVGVILLMVMLPLVNIMETIG